MNKNHETWMLCVLVCFDVIAAVWVWLFHFPIGKWLPQHSHQFVLVKPNFRWHIAYLGTELLVNQMIYIKFMFHLCFKPNEILFIFFLHQQFSKHFISVEFNSILSSHKFPIVIWFYFSWCFSFSYFLVIVLFMIGLWFNFSSLLVTKWT